MEYVTCAEKGLIEGMISCIFMLSSSFDNLKIAPE